MDPFQLELTADLEHWRRTAHYRADLCRNLDRFEAGRRSYLIHSEFIPNRNYQPYPNYASAFVSELYVMAGRSVMAPGRYENRLRRCRYLDVWTRARERVYRCTDLLVQHYILSPLDPAQPRVQPFGPPGIPASGGGQDSPGATDRQPLFPGDPPGHGLESGMAADGAALHR